MPARRRILMRSGRRRRQAAMPRSRRFLIGGVIIVAALSYMIYGGMQEAMVYFVTPSELKAKESSSNDKFLRLGGMVVKGSLQISPTVSNSPTGRRRSPSSSKACRRIFFPKAKAPSSKDGSAAMACFKRRRSWPSTLKSTAPIKTAGLRQRASFQPRKQASSDRQPRP